MSLLSTLRPQSWIENIELLDRVQEPDRNLTYLKAQLPNNWVMYLRELFTPDEKFYSYHLQDQTDQLILRYDNAHSYSGITTSPHHKHLEDNKVKPLFEPSLEAFLNEVKELLEDNA